MRYVRRRGSDSEMVDWGEHFLLHLWFGGDELCRTWMEECYLDGRIADFLGDVAWARK